MRAQGTMSLLSYALPNGASRGRLGVIVQDGH